MRVAIGVLTYCRPEGLRRLLHHLGQIEIRETDATAEIIVVDNDPLGGAQQIVEDARVSSNLPIRYLKETRRGISYGRNRCIDESIVAGFDILVFIDDDEVPGVNWLNELLGAMGRFQADAVAGPVLPRFEHKPPTWIRGGKFFDERRHPTGTACSTVGTGNVAIKLESIVESGLRFDERLALSGGEDSLFFLKFTRGGYSIIWVDEAYVEEYIPRSRMTARWLVQRKFRAGTVTSFMERVLTPSLSTLVLRLAKGFGRLIQGLILLPFAAFKGIAGVVQSVQMVSYGVGILAGLLGFLYFEYAMRHQD